MDKISDYVELCLALGIRGVVSGKEFRARCPLHNDTRPSFSLNIHSGMFICHAGCGQGEFQKLVELVLGCSGQEAREWVSDNGKQMAVENMSRQLIDTMNTFEQLAQSPAVAKNWLPYYESLTAKAMPLWFLNRGFAWSTVQHWGIRYDPIQDAVVIPVHRDGTMIGLITRNYIKTPKYQNSDGLRKSEVLFGEIKPNENLLILVEGVLDAIWLWQLGYNAVSLLGHDLSRRQVDIIKRHRYGEVCLGLDNDEAGLVGTRAAIIQLQQSGYLMPQLSYLKYPHKDAQECTLEEIHQAFNQRKERSIELLAIV